jgi:hypothetical protein
VISIAEVAAPGTSRQLPPSWRRVEEAGLDVIQNLIQMGK